MKKLRITVSGKVYDVTVEVLEEGSSSSALPGSPAKPGGALRTSTVEAPASASPQAASAAAAGDVVSPLAGKVVSIAAKVGDAVKEGDTLVVLEAMKMNTHVQANQSGKVTAIHVKPGDSVEEGQGLLSLG
ncbi:MAG: DUF2118 domain-containing protein [Puniceicoccaceae bacterium]|nr:MAG: DUF2118 domain-containing protein [Puniceicoccaceae bacterium]